MNLLVELVKKLDFRRNINLLVITIFVAIFSILLVFILFISNLKNVINDIYHYNISPITRLENIRDIYSSNIDFLITKFDTTYNKTYIELTRDSINQIIFEWNEYKKIPEFNENTLTFKEKLKRIFFKTSENFPYNYYKADLENKITKTLEEVEKTILIACEVDIPVAEMMHLKKELISINTNAHLLLIHHLKEINNKKTRTDYRYIQSLKFLSFSLIITIVFFFMLVFALTINSKKINEKLEKSVKRKTKALKELNENLEKRLEKELIISRKKDQTIFLQCKNASLGEMLENVSHQWRQPLGAISMIIQSFETKLEKNKLTPEFVKSQVNEAMILANGMSQTLEDFRSFYSPTKAKKTFTLNEVINDAIRLTKYLLQKKEIELIFDKSQEITIYSFKNELLQVLINIINNAKDAIDEKEDIKFIWIKLTKLDGFARVEIIDNGGGIDAIIIDKIFEPYFTTKHKSLGTGIGLYMSKNIVEKHLKGNLYVKNVILGRSKKEYKCANFIIDLPLKDESWKKEI